MHTIEEEPTEEESLSGIQPGNGIRSLGSGWLESVTPSGRLFYYNPETSERSWKPPRKLTGGGRDSSHVGAGSCGLHAREWKSAQLVSERTLDIDAKPTNVGKILRTGVLKTTSVDVSSGKVKKKWVKSFVVLTEFFILVTTVVGSFQKLFKTAKTPKPSRHYLAEAEVVKDTEMQTRCNVYRLKTPSSEILFRSKSATVAESWYQALTLVIDNFKRSRDDKCERFEFDKRERTNSFDFGMLAGRNKVRARAAKCTSLSDFGPDVTTVADGPNPKCLSDSFGVKYATPAGWITIFDAETEQFCYVNCITKKKWFRAMTDDGHPYFYEEGCARRAWLLPSIYLDVNSHVLEDIRRSTGSRKSIT